MTDKFFMWSGGNRLGGSSVIYCCSRVLDFSFLTRMILPTSNPNSPQSELVNPAEPLTSIYLSDCPTCICRCRHPPLTRDTLSKRQLSAGAAWYNYPARRGLTLHMKARLQARFQTHLLCRFFCRAHVCLSLRLQRRLAVGIRGPRQQRLAGNLSLSVVLESVTERDCQRKCRA